MKGMKGMLTGNDLSQFATKEDLQHLASKGGVYRPKGEGERGGGEESEGRAGQPEDTEGQQCSKFREFQEWRTTEGGFRDKQKMSRKTVGEGVWRVAELKSGEILWW